MEVTSLEAFTEAAVEVSSVEASTKTFRASYFHGSLHSSHENFHGSDESVHGSDGCFHGCFHKLPPIFEDYAGGPSSVTFLVAGWLTPKTERSTPGSSSCRSTCSGCKNSTTLECRKCSCFSDILLCMRKECVFGISTLLVRSFSGHLG